MNTTSFAQSKTSALNPYLVKEILEASPQKLLIKIYDFAITNCQLGDMAKTNRALDELINALNFEDEKSARNINRTSSPLPVLPGSDAEEKHRYCV